MVLRDTRGEPAIDLRHVGECQRVLDVDVCQAFGFPPEPAPEGVRRVLGLPRWGRLHNLTPLVPLAVPDGERAALGLERHDPELLVQQHEIDLIGATLLLGDDDRWDHQPGVSQRRLEPPHHTALLLRQPVQRQVLGNQ